MQKNYKLTLTDKIKIDTVARRKFKNDNGCQKFKSAISSFPATFYKKECQLKIKTDKILPSQLLLSK